MSSRNAASPKKGERPVLGSLLIGLDGPVHTDALADLGIGWVRRAGGLLWGLAIVDEPGVLALEPAWPVGGKPDRDPVYYRGYEGRLAELERQADQLLDQFGARCKLAGVPHAELKAVGSPHELIETHAQTCDLILLARGSHFRYIRHDDEGDETLKKVLRNAPRPLVVLPGTSTPEGPVVIAYDGSLQAARALAAFHATGLGESGRLHILSVHSSAAEATRRAQRARQFLAHHSIEAHPVAVGSAAAPAKVILEQAQRLGAGLLVMGAYGQPALREFVIGSVTRTVLQETTIPVFLFH
jgi:nucleotide-binding universal stress UspA family protein